MRSTGRGRQPSRDRRHLHRGHSLGKAWLPRHLEEIPGSSYLARLSGKKQGKQLSSLQRISVLNPDFRFVSRFLSLRFTSGAFCSAAAGSRVRCRRSRRGPGEPGLGAPWRAARGDALGPGDRSFAVRGTPLPRPRRAGGYLWAPRAASAPGRRAGRPPCLAGRRGCRARIRPPRPGVGLPAPQWALCPHFIPPSAGV